MVLGTHHRDVGDRVRFFLEKSSGKNDQKCPQNAIFGLFRISYLLVLFENGVE